MSSTPRAFVPNPITKPTISIAEAGRLLGLGRDASYEMARKGVIPVLPLGRYKRVPTAKFLSEVLGIKPEMILRPRRKPKLTKT